MDWKIITCDEVTSTNDVAKELALKGEKEGVVVTANAQKKGRGRQGRRWVAHPNKSVCLSVILRPPWQGADVNWLGVLGGIATAECLVSAGIGGISIKWPNDVLVNGRKIAGVLVEPRWAKSQLDFAILGIGINVKQELEDWPVEIFEKATSCRLEGVEISCDAVIERLLNKMALRYSLMMKQGPQSLASVWTAWSGRIELPSFHSASE